MATHRFSCADVSGFCDSAASSMWNSGSQCNDSSGVPRGVAKLFDPSNRLVNKIFRATEKAFMVKSVVDGCLCFIDVNKCVPKLTPDRGGSTVDSVGPVGPDFQEPALLSAIPRQS